MNSRTFAAALRVAAGTAPSTAECTSERNIPGLQIAQNDLDSPPARNPSDYQGRHCTRGPVFHGAAAGSDGPL